MPVKHVLFHGKGSQLPLTVDQAARLLKKKLVQKTGTMPGQVNYHSNANMSSLKKEMTSVAKKSKPVKS